jgi:hypothetical protein
MILEMKVHHQGNLLRKLKCNLVESKTGYVEKDQAVTGVDSDKAT